MWTREMSLKRMYIHLGDADKVNTRHLQIRQAAQHPEDLGGSFEEGIP